MKARALVSIGLVAAGLLLLLLSRSDSAERRRDPLATTSRHEGVAGGVAADEKAGVPRAVAGKPGELDPVRPKQPPALGHYIPPSGLPHPAPPPDARRIKTEAWEQAQRAHDPRPGETAFRAMAHAFVQHNQRFAKAQAEREGLSLEEIHELTYFGLMAEETQRWGEVERLLGRQVGEDERRRARTWLDQLNQEFKANMRQLVADGASIDQRWQLIRTTEARYASDYFAITGMDEDLLDTLLAGDVARAYAASATPPIEAEAPSHQDPNAPQQRPQTPPAQ